MLVHKATMGVLDRLWTGRHTLGPDGRQVPVELPAVLADVDDPTEWWEIPSQSLLARKIRQYYPLLRPVMDENGGLVEAVPLCSEADQEAAEKVRETKAARIQEAARRGYRNAGRVRPLGLMPFLNCTPPHNEKPAVRE